MSSHHHHTFVGWICGHVADVLTQGEEVNVRIISVDTEKNQIAVTIRSVEAEAKANDGGGGSQA